MDSSEAFPTDEGYQRVDMVGKGTYGYVCDNCSWNSCSLVLIGLSRSVYKAITPDGRVCVLKRVTLDSDKQSQGVGTFSLR